MKIRNKLTGIIIDDVYREGSVISKNGTVSVYYQFGDRYKKPYYGDEYVIIEK